MTDWRERGDVVRGRGRQFLSAFAMNGVKHLLPHQIVELDKRRPHSVRGRDPTAIFMEDMPVAWLSVGFVDAYDPIRFNYREWLYAHPDRLDWETDSKNGRPLGDATRAAATLACSFYEAWRSENKKLGINDYGHRREMKDFAAQAVVEDIFAVQFGLPKLAWRFGGRDVESFIGIVRDLMEKPKKRRDPGNSASFDFLAGPTGLLFHLPPKPTRK